MRESSFHSIYIEDIGTVVYEQVKERPLGAEYPGDLRQVVRGLAGEETSLEDLTELDPDEEEKVRHLLRAKGAAGYGPVEFNYTSNLLEQM